MRDHLDKLESKSVHILREAYAAFGNLCMLWSIGKDSTVLLWLARKAFYGHVPFPLVHIDTHYKIPEMIEYRDKLAMEYGLYMVYGENREALENHETFPDGMCSRSMYSQTFSSVQSSRGWMRTCVPGAKSVLNWFQNSGGWSSRSQSLCLSRGEK